MEVRPGHYDHKLGAEVGEDIGAGLAEPVAISEQHDHRGDAPRHAQHGERGAAAVVSHGAVGFAVELAESSVIIIVFITLPLHSCRSASTGCSIAALRAG